MANPNIVSVQRILANTVTGNFAASNTVFVTNPASSGAVYKINSILITNVDGVTASNADLIISNPVGSNTLILNQVNVPIQQTLVAIDKNSSIYLQENSTIGGQATEADDLSYTISFEQIYDT